MSWRWYHAADLAEDLAHLLQPLGSHLRVNTWEQLSRNDDFQTRVCSGLVPRPHIDGRPCVLAELYVDSTRVERQLELQSTNTRNGKSAPSAKPRSQFVAAATVAEPFVSEQVVCAVVELRSGPVHPCRSHADLSGDLGESCDGRSGSRCELSVPRWISFVLYR